MVAICMVAISSDGIGGEHRVRQSIDTLGRVEGWLLVMSNVSAWKVSRTWSMYEGECVQSAETVDSIRSVWSWANWCGTGVAIEVEASDVTVAIISAHREYWSKVMGWGGAE